MSILTIKGKYLQTFSVLFNAGNSAFAMGSCMRMVIAIFSTFCAYHNILNHPRQPMSRKARTLTTV